MAAVFTKSPEATDLWTCRCNRLDSLDLITLTMPIFGDIKVGTVVYKRYAAQESCVALWRGMNACSPEYSDNALPAPFYLAAYRSSGSQFIYPKRAVPNMYVDQMQKPNGSKCE